MLNFGHGMQLCVSHKKLPKIILSINPIKKKDYIDFGMKIEIIFFLLILFYKECVQKKYWARKR